VRLLLDENASDRRFVAQLRAAGHDVETTTTSLGVGASDHAIFAYAIQTARVIVTRDCDDFRALAAASAGHPGLLLIFAGSVAAVEALVRADAHVEAHFPNMDDLVLSLVEFSW
jgi:predicted nuclease of predicted toxin-antitoxin system